MSVIVGTVIQGGKTLVNRYGSDYLQSSMAETLLVTTRHSQLARYRP
jgi:hypothetical protein